MIAKKSGMTAAQEGAQTFHLQGSHCMKAGQHRQALSWFQKALAHMPDDPVAHYNAGVACQKLGYIDDAAGHYQQAVTADPRFGQAFFNLGMVHMESKDAHSAISAFENTLKIDPTHSAAHYHLGRLLMDRGRLEQARQSLENALQSDPHMAKAWFYLAEIYQRQGQPALAVDAYQRALSKSPDLVAAHNNMGNTLLQLGRFSEAIDAFNKVVAAKPGSAQGHFNLGSAYAEIQRFEKAARHLAQAVRLKPDHARAWNNLALACKNMGGLDEALACFGRALKIDPEFALAHWNRSFVLLTLERWPEAWQDFEYRFSIPGRQKLYPHRLASKRWRGEPMPGQTILVHDEQGFGDTIHFIRYLPRVKEHCAKVVLETRKELASLFETCKGVDDIVIRSNTSPPTIAHDAHVPLMSLPGIFGQTPDTIPGFEVYIHPPQDRSAIWSRRLPHDRPKVGLVWAGRPEHANDANRSCHLEEIAQLFQLNDVRFVGLQKGQVAQEADRQTRWPNFINRGAELDSFTETAALIANLDLVITVDTSVAHLAGAMGRPSWLMLPFIPDWRWGVCGSRTPWYPTMRLYRQTDPKNWASVIRAIQRDLTQVTAPSTSRPA